jgi:2-(1,2-epoxy-1,2-dihydrophenyl)acetyl-CoA isomerase
MATILLAIQDQIARLTLNRPERLNSFTVEMHGDIAAALDQVDASDARVLVLTGAGRGFCAGQDLSDRLIAPGEAIDLGASIEQFYNPLLLRLCAMDMPIVGAVNGVAAGAGANLALACDIVIATRGARFIQSFAGIGLIPDCGGTWVLARLVGQARAMALALTGEPLSAEQAAEWGMIWKCVDDEAFAAEVDALAAKLATAPTKGLAATRKLIRDSAARGLDQQLDAERDAQRALGGSHDFREGVAAFTEKRPPRFIGN